MMKACRRFFIALFLCLILSFSPFSFAANGDTIVYITKTVSKYHTGSCSYLKKSKIEISLSSAVARGYEPCSRCNPPRLTSNSTTTRQAEPTSKATISSATIKPTNKSSSKNNKTKASTTKKPTSTPSTYSIFNGTTNGGTSTTSSSRQVSTSNPSNTPITLSTIKPSSTKSNPTLSNSVARASLSAPKTNDENSSSHFGLIAVAIIAFLAGRFIKKRKS